MLKMCVFSKATLIFYWNNKETEQQENITNSLCLENGFYLQVTIILCVLIIITFMAVICYFKLHNDRYVW